MSREIQLFTRDCFFFRWIEGFKYVRATVPCDSWQSMFVSLRVFEFIDQKFFSQRFKPRPHAPTFSVDKRKKSLNIHLIHPLYAYP